MTDALKMFRMGCDIVAMGRKAIVDDSYALGRMEGKSGEAMADRSTAHGARISTTIGLVQYNTV